MTHRNPSTPRECVEWVRRVNSRWLVHDGLDQSARAYMEHLEQSDPQRLERSCVIARRMIEHNSGSAIDDPKPRFYGGLFCLATPGEAERYFNDRLFLAALWSGTASASDGGRLGEATLRKIEALRGEIAGVRAQIEGGEP